MNPRTYRLLDRWIIPLVLIALVLVVAFPLGVGPYLPLSVALLVRIALRFAVPRPRNPTQ